MDACVLWDIRVADAYKYQGIGQQLLDMGVAELEVRDEVQLVWYFEFVVRG